MKPIALISPTFYEAEYFRNLLAQYDGQKPVDSSQIEARIAELRQQSNPDGAAVCELEVLVARLYNHEDLVVNLPILRNRYAAVTGQPAPSSNTDQSSDTALRAEAVFLAVQIHRAYGLNRLFEKIRQQMVVLMFAAAVVVIFLLLGFNLLKAQPATVIDMVMCAGLLGGFTSCLRRVYTMTNNVDPVSAAQSLAASRTSIIAAPALGCVFALVMHLCFVGGLVSGPMFPELNIKNSTPDGNMYFGDFFYGTIEAKAGDFAKLLIWSFIAGFAERLLPDLLDSFANKAKSAKSP